MVVVHVLLSALWLCFQIHRKHVVFLSVVKRTRDFVTRTIVQVGCYLSHCSCKAYLLAHSCIIIKLGVEIVEALSASPSTNKSILTVDEDNSVVIPHAKISKRYNPPAVFAMFFILAIPG
ncbi:UNVERIFIED_CONTAM: hypothetical protein NCL1_20770 [Trichonephila clavipes]